MGGLVLFGGVLAAWTLSSGSSQQPPAVATGTEASAADPLDESPSEVFRAVLRAHASLPHFSASFRQTYQNPTYADRRTLTGSLDLERVGYALLDYDDALDPDYWSAEGTTWEIDHDQRVVVPAAEESLALELLHRLLLGDPELTKSMLVRFPSSELERLTEAGQRVLELKPKDPGARDDLRGVRVIVDVASRRVDGLVLYHPDRSTNAFEFTPVERAPRASSHALPASYAGVERLEDLR